MVAEEGIGGEGGTSHVGVRKLGLIARSARVASWVHERISTLKWEDVQG